MSKNALINNLVTIYDNAVSGTCAGRDSYTLAQYKQEALDAISKELKEVASRMTMPPSEKEAAYIATLQGRSTITEAELQAGMRAYPSHAVQRALIDAGIRCGIIGEESTTDAEDYVLFLQGKAMQVSDAFSAGNIEKAAGSVNSAALGRGQIMDTGETDGMSFSTQLLTQLNRGARGGTTRWP